MNVLLEDTRNQSGKHEEKHTRWAEQGVLLTRSKIIVGDYCLPPAKSVDTKASMSEIAQNIGGGKDEHQRFIRELKLAQAIGCKLFVLIENEDGIESIEDVVHWRNPRTEYSPKCIQGPRLAKAMRTIQERYGCVFLFCRPDEAADMITDLLR
jgi:hypothetical protein